MENKFSNINFLAIESYPQKFDGDKKTDRQTNHTHFSTILEDVEKESFESFWPL